jgi:hypothetical protein
MAVQPTLTRTNSRLLEWDLRNPLSWLDIYYVLRASRHVGAGCGSAVVAAIRSFVQRLYGVEFLTRSLGEKSRYATRDRYIPISLISATLPVLL